MAASSKLREAAKLQATTIGILAEARAEEAAKIARLRALRLAKEADDGEAERTESAASAKPTRARVRPVPVRLTGRRKLVERR